MSSKLKHAKQQVAKPKFSLEAWLNTRYTLFSSLIVLLAASLALLLFDLKIGVGGDDSEYIKRAFDLVHEGLYPSFQGPLYPLVISPFVWIGGINIPLLKFLSFGFLLGGLWVFLQSFRGRVQAAVALLSGLAVGASSLFLFYASQTYVEAFFFLLLSITLSYSFAHFVQRPDVWPQRNSLKEYLVMSLLLLVLGLSKTIGWAFVPALLAFWLVQRMWRTAVAVSGLLALWLGIWAGAKRLIWQADRLQFSDQATTLLLKNPYVPSEGQEELSGFLQRFWDNLGIYLSKHFLAYFDLRQITDIPSSSLGLLVAALLLGATILVWRQNRYLLLTAFVVLAMLGLSFVVLQKIWDTQRLIMPFVPYMLILLAAALAQALPRKYSTAGAGIAYLVLFIFFSSALSKSLADRKLDRLDLKSYFSGNTLKGYTPDWVNFIRMSQWAAQNLPDSVTIACRKPAISFLHTGRKFHGIFRIPMHDERAFVDSLKRLSTEFVVLDEQALAALNIPMQQLIPWKRNLSGFIAGTLGAEDGAESRFYGVYQIPNDTVRSFAAQLQQSGLRFEPVDSLLQALLPHDATLMAILPDELRDELLDRNAQYVIMANLRKYEAQKTPYTINTIQRYMFYLQYKYPMILEQISEVGDDEKAYLFKMHFENAR